MEDIKFVINYDYPNSSEDYVHRIGRTGRSSQTGTAYTFFTPGNIKQAKDLIDVLQEAKQVVNPKLLQLAESARGFNKGRFRGGRSNDYGGSRFGGSRFGGSSGGSRFGGSSRGGFGNRDSRGGGDSFTKGFGNTSRGRGSSMGGASSRGAYSNGGAMNGGYSSGGQTNGYNSTPQAAYGQPAQTSNPYNSWMSNAAAK